MTTYLQLPTPWILLLLGALQCSFFSKTQGQAVRPRPEFNDAQFDLAKDLELKPFAVDQLSNPCSIDVDDRGRVWVAEAVNYRKKTRRQGDRILILEDTNLDGKADLTKVFYQNSDIDGVHGVCVLGNTVIVSASDRILVLADVNGDDVADSKKLLFRGNVIHAVHGQHDHAIHAVMFGPDGRLYFNFGNFNTELRHPDGTLVRDIYGKPVNNARSPYQEGMVIRCELDGSRVEVLGHNFRNNWEVTVDSYGSLWQSDNDNGSSACRVNYVMENGNYGYRDELTGNDYRTPRTNLETTPQDQMWHQNDPGVVPNLLITGFGAPTGILVYEGELLPKPFRNQLIHAEPGRNRVWAFPTQVHGAGYKATIADLASSEKDLDYRPCDVSVAPDGSLFIADWYDPVDCCHKTLNDAGRLFRVAPAGHRYSRVQQDYQSIQGAIKALCNPNLATRYRAWTALKGFGDLAIPEIQRLAKHPRPRYRARALWAFAEISHTPLAAIQLALTDSTPEIRCLALRIARRHQLKIEPFVKQLAEDTSPQVRRECAIALHRRTGTDAVDLWVQLALQHDGADRWYTEALGIGETGKENECFQQFLDQTGNRWSSKRYRDVIWRSRANQAAKHLTLLLQDPALPTSEHPRWIRALDFHRGPVKQQAIIEMLTSKTTVHAPTWLEIFKRVSSAHLADRPEITAKAQRLILVSKGTTTFVDFVARYKRTDLIPELMDMAVSSPGTEPGIRAVAQIIAFQDWKPLWKAIRNPSRSSPILKSLGYIDNVHAKNFLTNTATDSAQPESIRLLAISSMAHSRTHALELIRLLDTAKLPPEFIPAAIRALTLSPTPDTRLYAAKNKHRIIPKEQQWPIDKLISGRAEIKNGKAAFEKGGCFQCHRLLGQGIDFGPDLSQITNQLTERQLFSAILHPSETISLGYETELVLTDDGKLHSGFIIRETEKTLVMRVSGGRSLEIIKTSIEERKRSDLSTMPQGIGGILAPQELVDLVGWLKAGSPGNKP
ncbi:MAG: PVC-type heme-binding CxxCH protein [Planctomycetota bacterium]|nr:PVC-type heme-binding CxxCH protein [Planctomycetota bacterium]